MAETPEQVLANAAGTLKTAQIGLKDFMGSDPSRRLSGFRNAVVFGRAVTNVLEHLRGKVPDFDEWYKPRSAALAKDEGFARLYKLRSQILKEGTGQPSVGMHVARLDTARLAPLMSNPPPNARAFFIGDQVGGSGWEVVLADGEVEKYYVALPPGIDVSFSHHLGDENAEELLSRYLAAMGDLIAEGRLRFASE